MTKAYKPAHAALQRRSSSARRPAPSAPRSALLALRDSLGNGSFGAFLQTKLTVGRPDDPYEREADHVADRVTAQPAGTTAPPAILALSPDPRHPVRRQLDDNEEDVKEAADETPDPEIRNATEFDVQRNCAECEGDEEETAVQTKRQSSDAPMAMAPATASGVQAMRGHGEPLAPSLRNYFEPRFGRDFGSVRTHTGTLADQTSHALGARAYTVGSDIAFRAGAFSPQSDDGRRLLAHELTHVVQQSGGRGGGTMIHRKPAGPTPYDRIKKLLSRNIGDWAVTDEEAVAAIKILRNLKPREQLETIVRMKYSGAWKRLYEQLPSNSPVDFDYFAMTPLNRTTGYIMPHDRINLELYVRGKLERRASGEYTVHEDGLHLDDNKNQYLVPEFRGELKEPIRITEMMPEAAVNKIAAFFIDRLIFPGAQFFLNVSRRGHLWGPEAGPTRGIPVQSTYTRPDTAESRLRDKRARFAEYAAQWGTEKYVHRILAFYWHDVDNNLDKWKTPEDLWTWAETQASKPPPESPIEPFYSFYLALKKERDFVSPVNRGTWQDAMDRYYKWLDAHIDDPNIGKYKPADIWSKAIRNALTVEAKRFSEEFLRKEKDRREHPTIDWEAAGKKLDKALEFITRKIYHTPEPQYLEAKSEGISYLVWPSNEEKLIRRQIGDDFLHDIVSRMGNPDFLQTSVEADYNYYLATHDEQARILELTQRHPFVEHAALDKPDLPWWQTAIEIAVGFIPIVGQVVGTIEAIAGYDMFGNPLSDAERAIIGASILLPATRHIYKHGKAMYTVDKFSDLYRLSPSDADALYRVTAGIKPGSRNATLLDDTARRIKKEKAGTVLNDPKVQRDVEKVLDDMHFRERATVQDLKRPGSLTEKVGKQADEIADKEIKNLGSTTGEALNDETIKLLKQKPALRSALAESSLAARALKKCNTPCYPPNATPDQIRTLEQHLERVRITGKYNEHNLREFLYKNRDDLDKAIGDVMSHKTSRHLDEFLRKEIHYQPMGPRVPPREDPRIRGAMVERSHHIGQMHGRAYAGDTLGLKGVGFKNPFERAGKYGQGFDDIMVRGADLDNGIVFIVEYKGGRAVLDAGQMELDWVVGNIRRLFLEGGTAGQDLARKLSKALREGRLQGVALSTPLVGNAAQATREIATWAYDIKQLASKLSF
jgi:hypothetical protein